MFKLFELIVIFDGLLYFVFFVVFLNYEEFEFKYLSSRYRICIFFLFMSLNCIIIYLEDQYSKVGVFFVGNLCGLNLIYVEVEVKYIRDII